MPNFANLLISFKEDTTFTIGTMEFYTEVFDQEEPINIVQLTIEDTLWNVSLYEIIMGVFGFGVTSMVISFFAFIIIKYKRRNQGQMVSVNQSRVYFDPSMHDIQSYKVRKLK